MTSRPDDRPTKPCPDCAEIVLAAARKCRFCGFRFDAPAQPAPAQPAPAPAPAPAPRSEAGPLGMLFRGNAASKTLPDVLTEWGIDPGQADDDTMLCHATIDGDIGFIVLSRTRFYFVPAGRIRALPRVREEHALQDLLRVHVRRHLLRRQLVIEWRDRRTVVETSRTQLEELVERLRPHQTVMGSKGSPAAP